ncbi:MAG: type I restriction enzyme HsdR N-terminal domain-containing protein [Crocinitomicaceae bacterium]
MTPLNLPRTVLKLTRSGQQIYVWCPLRKKKLVLTPEEWVRQHFIGYLINELAISPGKIVSEYSLSYNNMSRRADLVVIDSEGKPEIIVECKAPQIPLSDKTFFQIAQYKHTLSAKILILTNGIDHMAMNLSEETKPCTSNLTEMKNWLD